MLLLLSCAINDPHTLVQAGADAASAFDPRIEPLPGAVRIDGLEVDAVSWGRPGRHTALPQATGGIGAAGGGRAGEELTFSGGGLSEWWRSSGRAVQQGFLLESRPEGAGPVQIRVETGADRVSPQGVSGASGGELMLEEEGRLWRVSGLAAWDAAGRRLPARFVAGMGWSAGASAGGFGIEVDDAGAAWPIAVDPYYSVIGAELANPFGSGSYLTLEAGDANADGYSDLIRTAQDSGGFTPKWLFTSFGGPAGQLYQYGPGFNFDTMLMGNTITWGGDLAIGDYNGDGYADAVASEDYNLRFNVYNGSATGYTGLSSTVSYTATYRFSEQLEAADIDGDGYDDILAIGRDYLDPTEFLIFNGSAAGLSATPSWTGLSSVGGGIEYPLIGDVDGDGEMDVVVYELFSQSVYVFYGPSFPSAPDQTLSGVAGESWALFDLDGDGDSDLVMGRTDGVDGRVEVYAGGGSGLAAAPIVSTTGSYDDGCTGVGQAKDLSGDGIAELLVTCQPQTAGFPGGLQVYAGGSLSLGAPASTVTGTTTQVWYNPRSIGDFDGDGNQDYAVLFYDSSILTNGIYAFFAPFDRDGDGFDEQSDCNDLDAASNPSAAEVCDGQDNDCDGAIDEGLSLTFYRDADGDGFGDAGNTLTDCTAQPGWVADSTDCNDSASWMFPGNAEYCDGIDNDCNGLIDEAGGGNWYTDADGDGFGGGAPVVDCNQPPGTTGIDGDCDDGDAAIYPGASEYCDGIDNDCNGTIDDGFPVLTWYDDIDGDGFGDGATAASGCGAPSGTVSDGSDCDDSDAGVNPGAAEVCDGLDNDCDGTPDDGLSTSVWYADADGDSFGNAGATVTACAQPIGYVSGGADCNDGAAGVYPGATEICDGIDQDCDSAIDDGLPVLTWYADTDGDGYGAGAATTGCAQPGGTSTTSNDCNNSNAAVHPGATEIPGNGIDDDCSGTGCSSVGGSAGLSVTMSAIMLGMMMARRRRDGSAGAGA